MRTGRLTVHPIDSLTVKMARRLVLIVGSPLALACGGDSTSPSSGPPAHLNAVSDLNRAAVVGDTIPGGLVVSVTDASGRPVSGASVAFAVTGGNGSTSPRIATTGSNGQAKATWNLGTIAGDNVVETPSPAPTTPGATATPTTAPTTAPPTSGPVVLPRSITGQPAAEQTCSSGQTF